MRIWHAVIAGRPVQGNLTRTPSVIGDSTGAPASLKGGMRPKPWFTEADVRAWVKRTRGKQGLPEHLEDKVVIARIAAILRLAREDELRRQARLKSMGTKRRMSSR